MQSSLSYEQAADDLHLIRRTMERSVRYSNFAGLSGVAGGAIALLGLLTETRANNSGTPFVTHWLVVIAAALGFDFIWTRRRARSQDKAVLRRLTHRMALAALPALFGGLALTLAFVAQGRAGELFPYWMIAYGAAMSSVGLIAPREVSWMARGFLGLGAAALAFQVAGFAWVGMPAFALSFGLLHCVYGVYIGVREGW